MRPSLAAWLAALAALTQGAAQEPEFDVQADYTHVSVRRETEKRVYAGGVAARFFPAYVRVAEESFHHVRMEDPHVFWDVDELRAREIELDESKMTVVARGDVTFTDPIGTMDATEVFFDYGRRRGHARNAVIHAQGAVFVAEVVEMLPGEWAIWRGHATTCSADPPDYSLFFDKVSIRPGVRAKLYKWEIRALGHRLFKLPYLAVSLARRTNQISIPSFGYNRRTGVRVSWRNEFEVGPRAGLIAELAAFERSQPERRELVSYSLLGGDSHDAPDTEEGERFTNSYVDNVNVPSPEEEDRRLSSRRSVLFFENSSNLPVDARVEGDLIVSKDWEFGYQANSRIGPAFGTLAFRAGRLTESPGGVTVERMALQGTASGGSLWLGPTVALRARADASLFQYNGREVYGWVRPSVGLMFEPSDRFRLSASFVRTLTGGQAMLRFDEPVRSRTLSSRADMSLGKVDLSVLTKYDLDERHIYDVEVSLSVLLHCVQPVLVWRESTGEFRLGIRIPAVDLLQILTRKRLER